MTIYPAIDIKGGRCVRLTQGRADQETVYAEDPAAVAAEFRAAGAAWVHVVDLDGAFTGEPLNLAVVQKIAALGMKVQLGGGLRTRAAIERFLRAFAERYRDTGVIEAVLLGITGIYGESIYPAGPEGHWRKQ